MYVPDEQTEALRDLERCRDAAKKAETTAKHQLSKFLLRQGRRWEGGSNWTLKHRDWIRRQTFDQEAHCRVLRDDVKALEDATERVERLTSDIEELVATTALAPLVTAMQSMRGIATISSVVVAAEIGDLRRFDSAKKFMSYVGLVPSEHSSGKRTRRGSITRLGRMSSRHDQATDMSAAFWSKPPGITSGRLR